MEIKGFFSHSRGTGLAGLLFLGHMFDCSMGLSTCSNHINGTNYHQGSDTKVDADNSYLPFRQWGKWKSYAVGEFSSGSQGEVNDRS